MVQEAKELGIDKILIQPGAESEEIINYCKENSIEAVEGCALVELSRLKNKNKKVEKVVDTIVDFLYYILCRPRGGFGNRLRLLGQAVKTPPFHGGNRGSIPLGVTLCGRIAQLGEHLPYKQRVTGSSPVVPTTYGPVAQLVRVPVCHAGGRGSSPFWVAIILTQSR